MSPEPRRATGRGRLPQCAWAMVVFAATFIPLVGCSRPEADNTLTEAGHGAVASVCETASGVGVDVLKKGGNAVDAAVAVGFALAVTYPPAGNIGGGGFMLVYPGNGRRPVCVDYRETAPAAATVDMLSGDVARTDARMVGVPGTVRGLALAHREFGKLAWRDLVQPAVELAEKGFVVNAELAASLNEVRQRYPQMAGLQAAFRPPEGKAAWSGGDRLVQRELAATLRLIANAGPEAFYEGTIADQIVAEMRATGGAISREDLRSYQPKLREPVRGTYRGYDILAAPPPSSGGVALIEMLNMLEPFELRREGRWSPKTLHILIEVMRRAYRDRAAYLGDPDFSQIPASLTSKEYARQSAASIDPTHATPSERLAGPIRLREEGDSTTHFSIIDKDGMAVANTYTLERSYGAKIVVGGAGFLLNNEMGDFNARPGVTDRDGHVGTPPNLIAPGKRMLSAMTPTIVTHNGRAVLITGSPGGRTIINTVLCVVLNSLEFEMGPREAVDAPRLHHQWFPDKVRLEAVAEPISEAALNELHAIGHTITREDPDGDAFIQGDAHSIFVREGRYVGVSDRRIHGGGAVGY